MSRKQMILLSVLINAGLLTVLFITAIKSDPDEIERPQDIVEAIKVENIPAKKEVTLTTVTEDRLLSSMDEVDNVLKEFLPELPLETASSLSSSNEVSSPKETYQEVPPKDVVEISKAKIKPAVNQDEAIVEVTVKRGDALEKIARAHRTTIEAIRKKNHLTSDRLKIGQVLEVPVGKQKSDENKTIASKEPSSNNSADATYYTMKSGDSLWKIAKQNNLKFEELLKLNNLNESSAKNLKVGDKVRIK